MNKVTLSRGERHRQPPSPTGQQITKLAPVALAKGALFYYMCPALFSGFCGCSLSLLLGSFCSFICPSDSGEGTGPYLTPRLR